MVRYAYGSIPYNYRLKKLSTVCLFIFHLPDLIKPYRAFNPGNSIAPYTILSHSDIKISERTVCCKKMIYII